MDRNKDKSLIAKLAVLKTYVRNVATLGQGLSDNDTRIEYQKIYDDIKETLADPNLEIYAPNISYSQSYGGTGLLWPEHQVEIINSATKLITYLEAVLNSELTPSMSPKREPDVPANIFISHGRESQALDLTRDFINSIGLIPVIVMDQPSQGMSLDTKVTAYMKSCQAAIILATGDERVVGNSNFQPRQNVIHEIGLAQQLLTNRITYLLEDNTAFPSNIAPKVYERFSKDNLSKAFIAIVRDLRAFGLF